MRKTIHARFAIKKWEENPIGDANAEPKITRAMVSKTLTGELEGESHLEYLMMYRGDGSASIVGLERVTGRIGDKEGSFVLKRLGEFEHGEAKELYSIIPGSGTGGLKGISGDGRSSVGHGMEHPFEIEIAID